MQTFLRPIPRRRVRLRRLVAEGPRETAIEREPVTAERTRFPEPKDLPKTILVVDDIPDTRLMIRELLEWYGFRVLEAGDGSEALKTLKHERVSIIITDLYMPDMDGIQLLHHLRNQAARCRVVAMSGVYHLGHPSTTATASLLGADAVLNKPFTGTELFRALGLPGTGGTDREIRF